MTNPHGVYASGRLRDQFLASLDNRDASLSHSLAEQLSECCDALPGMTCDELGLPRHSTYACAARVVLEGTHSPGSSAIRLSGGVDEAR